MHPPFEILIACAPGLEPLVAAEAAAIGLPAPTPVPGGVRTEGGWPEVRRANLHLRLASRVLVRLAAFRALHPAQLDKRARKLPWADLLRPDVPLRVEATVRRSRIWHAGAAASRVLDAARDAVGAPEGPDGLRLLVRLEDDLCTLSLDASGEPLHRRGADKDVGKAPLRETLAAAMLQAAGWRPEEPLLDPMAGSGTLPLEAAAIAAGLAPGRARAFAFERTLPHDAAAWAAERAAAAPGPPPDPPRFRGADRDAAAVAAALRNAAATDLAAHVRFTRAPISDFAPPEDLPGPGLILTNPPYGARLGAKGPLRALHVSLGRVLAQRFRGWRVGLITAEPALARATGLPFGPPGPPLPHGPLKIRLHLTGPLP